LRVGPVPSAILKTLPEPESATKRFSLASTVRPCGLTRLATGTTLCVYDVPECNSIRTRLLPVSEINTSPKPSTATPAGALSPLLNKTLCVKPPSPVAVSSRMRLLPVSAM